MWLDEFPPNDYIEIPLPPLQSITSIKYYDTTDTEATMAASDYIVDTTGFVGRVVLADGKSWPSTSLRPAKGICIEFVCGYTTYSATVNTADAIVALYVVNGGSGYSVDDILTIVQSGGSGGTAKVLTVDESGAIETVQLVTGGQGYVSASGLSTTVSPAGGSLATVAIVADHKISKTAGDDFVTSWPEGKLVTINAVTYRVSSVADVGALVVATTAGNQLGAVFQADDLPEEIRAAILLMIGHLYENREAGTERALQEIPFGVKSLLDMNRVVPI